MPDVTCLDQLQQEYPRLTRVFLREALQVTAIPPDAPIADWCDVISRTHAWLMLHGEEGPLHGVP